MTAEMSLGPSGEEAQKFQKMAFWFACAIGGIGLLALTGFILDIHLLRSFLPHFAPLISLPSTVNILCVSIAMFLYALFDSKPWSRRAIICLLLVPLSVAGYFIVRSLWAAQFDVISLLIQDYGIVMPFLSAMSMGLGALSFMSFILWKENRWGTLLSGLLAMLMVQMNLYALLGYLLKLPVLYDDRMSLPSSLSYVLIGTALLIMTTPFEGFLVPLFSKNTRVRLLTMFALTVGILILVEGMTDVSRFHHTVEQGMMADVLRFNYFYVMTSFSNIGLSILMLVGALEAIYYFEASTIYQREKQVAQRETQRAEEALEASYRQLEDFKKALDASDIVAITDTHGVITYVNDAFCRISGYTRDELIGQTHRLINSGYHPKSFFKSMWSAIGHGHVWHAEIKNKAKDGSYYWVDTTIVPFLRDDGRPYQYIAVRHDITERKRVEEQLRMAFDDVKESEARFRTIADESPMFIVMVDLAMRTTFLNKTWIDFTGQSFRESPVRPFLAEVLHPDDVDRTVDMYQQAALSPHTFSLENRLRSREGEYFWVLWHGTPRFLPNGEFLGFMSSGVDITVRKHMEEALRNSESQWRTLANSIPQLAWMADQTGWIFWYNQRWYEYTGLPIESVEGWGWQQAHHPDHVDRVTESIQYAFIHGTPWEDTFPLRSKEGQWRWFLSRALPIRNDAGEVIRWFGSNTDITDELTTKAALEQLTRELEHRVAERTAALEESNKELESFSYSISHDLRAPLRSIDGFSRLVLAEQADKLDDEGRRYLRFIRENTQRMGELIDDLLQLSRVGRAEVKQEPVDLSQLATQVLEELQLQEPHRHLMIHVQDGCLATGDRILLRTVLQNLLANAWKFTSKTEQARIDFGCDQDDTGKPVYYVKDNGAGFDPAYAGKLFGAFQRLHDARDFPGTGIGLATVKRIINRHGGEIWAEGQTNQGANFYFTLGSRKIKLGT